jgi:CBS domain-containing protein
MHGGVLTCTLDTSLRDVARIMARYRVHAVVAIGGHSVTEALQSSPWGIAALMREHQVTHLVVVDPDFALPVGVLSTLDIAKALPIGRW